MSTPLEIRIGEAVIVTDGDLVETRFEDGTVCRAFPEDTPEYRKTAQDLGYGSDIGRLNRTHDPSHSVLAEARGLPYSPVLWAVAHGEPEPEHWQEEETEAMSLQRYANGGPRPAGTLDWDAIRDRLIEVTR